jgi:hypothetical protein
MRYKIRLLASIRNLGIRASKFGAGESHEREWKAAVHLNRYFEQFDRPTLAVRTSWRLFAGTILLVVGHLPQTAKSGISIRTELVYKVSRA